MKIAFFSNFLNHHQLPFVLELYHLYGDDFTFVATKKTPHERILFGYEEMNNKYSFVLKEYASDENKKKAIHLSRTCDVVIFGSAPKKYLKPRYFSKKVTFRYSERILKEGLSKGLNPLRYLKNFLRFKILEKNFYLLSASAYASFDYNFYGGYKNRAFKWGYFPEMKKYKMADLFSKKNTGKIDILWVGRFINTKHPETMVNLAQELNKKGYNFTINLIGEGVEKNKIEEMVVDKRLEDKVRLLGNMNYHKVRVYMEKANIFVITSDFGEGWGAVLNEAMNSGCAVVSSHAVGAAPFLIDGKNGLLYEYGNTKDLVTKVEKLINNPLLRKNMGQRAYNSIKKEWNAVVAAKRLAIISEHLLSGKIKYYSNGPLSEAELLSNEIKKWGD